MKIITHNGAAHFDDFTACALILGWMPGSFSKIERKNEVLPADLEDFGTWVVDVGGVHDTRLHNFDHHQFERDAEPCCAISLLLKQWGYYETVKDVWPWLSPAEINDCKGPKALQEYFEAKKSLIGAKSPIEKFLLKQFAAADIVGMNDPLYTIMEEYGASLHQEIEMFKSRKVLWDSVSIEEADGISSIDVSHLFEGGDNPLFGAEAYLRGENVNVLISKDDRGTGFAMIRRRNANKLLDFSKVENHPLVSFAHKDGFVLKVKSEATKQDLATLIQLSKIS